MPNLLAAKSTQTWVEGKECLNQGHINAAASRLYYAVFQSVKGYAIHKGEMTMDDDNGVHRTVLNIVYGGGGKGKYYRRKLNELFQLRVIADYKPEPVNKADLEELLAVAEEMRVYYTRNAGGVA